MIAIAEAQIAVKVHLAIWLLIGVWVLLLLLVVHSVDHVGSLFKMNVSEYPPKSEVAV